jgi:hypothetical protein
MCRHDEDDSLRTLWLFRHGSIVDLVMFDSLSQSLSLLWETSLLAVGIRH